MKRILSVAVLSLFLGGCEVVIKHESQVTVVPKKQSNDAIAICGLGVQQINNWYVAPLLASDHISTPKMLLEVYETYTSCIESLAVKSNIKYETYDLFAACGGGRYGPSTRPHSYVFVRLKEEGWDTFKGQFSKIYGRCISTNLDNLWKS